MAEKTGVFVSHHHSPEEDAFTARLVADLKSAGADVWGDYQDVTSGSFPQRINDGLLGRQWLVLVMTPAALGSRWVQDEVNAGLHQVNGGRMRGVIPFVMTLCDEGLIPPLWAQLHRYDTTKDYEAARDGLLSAFGLSLPSAKVAQHPPRQDVAGQMTPADLRSLTPQEFENAVALMLTRSGYGVVERLEVGSVPDLLCSAPDGSNTFVWCKRYQPGNLVRLQVVIEAIGAVATARHPTKAMIETTSGYTPRALDKAKKHADQVTLIDGQQLVSMMQRVQPQ